MRGFGKLILGKISTINHRKADFANVFFEALKRAILPKDSKNLCQNLAQNLKKIFVLCLLASLAIFTNTALASQQDSHTSPCLDNGLNNSLNQNFNNNLNDKSKDGLNNAKSSKNTPQNTHNLDSFLLHSITPNSTYIFGNSKNIIVPKSKEFISTLASEVFSKSGIKLFVDVIDEVSLPSCFPTKESRKKYQAQVISKLDAPYVIIFLFVQEHKIDIVSSPNLHYISNAKADNIATQSNNINPSQESQKNTKEFLSPKTLDSIFFDYMAPLLPHKEEDFTPNRISGVILNGYAEIADRIADAYQFKLENNFPRDEEGVRNYVKFILYAMLFILLGLFAFAYLPRKTKSA
ncbi:hypothetical protein [Helicobacter sp. T3_23-1056]